MSASRHHISLHGREVPYRIRRSARARRARLRVATDGLSVSMPLKAAESAAEKLIREHASWVLKHLDDVAERQADARLTLDGRPAILLQGDPVAIERRPALKRVQREGSALIVRHSLKSPHTALADWLKEECRLALTVPIARAEEMLGKRQKGITLRDQKSRWGSCSSRGTLSFNWRLVMAPPFVLDYVACHEVAHLKHPNHSPAFWAEVDRLCDHVPEARQWLKANQHRLMVDLQSLFA